MGEDYKAVFEDYRDLRLSLDDFIKKTQDILSVTKNHRALQVFFKKRVDFVCHLKSIHVQNLVAGFMDNKISAENAAMWASMVRMNDAYRLDPSEPEQMRKIAAAVLLRIASPERYGLLTIDTANYYSHCLNSGAIPTN